jgi:hypothetical protein
MEGESENFFGLPRVQVSGGRTEDRREGRGMRGAVTFAIVGAALAGLLVPALQTAGGQAWGEGRPTNMLFNGSFEEGRQKPYCWDAYSLGAKWGFGGHDGERCVTIQGNAAQESWWYANRWTKVDYNKLYHVSYWARGDARASGGRILVGLNLANRYETVGPRWERKEFVFRSPDLLPGPQFRLGVSKTEGTVDFDDVSLQPVIAVHRSQGMGRYVLGSGESIVDGRYVAVHDLTGPFTSECRFLYRYTGMFNHDRVILDRLDEIVYHHDISRFGIPPMPPGLQSNLAVRMAMEITESDPDIVRSAYQDAITIELEVPRCDGCLLVEVNKTGGNWWIPLQAIERPGKYTITVPTTMLPQRNLWVKLKSMFATRIEVSKYRYQSVPGGRKWWRPVIGESRYLTVLYDDPTVDLQVMDVGELVPGGRSELRMALVNRGRWRKVRVAVSVQKGDALVWRKEEEKYLGTRSTKYLYIPYQVAEEGEQVLKISVADARTEELLKVLETKFVVARAAEVGARAQSVGAGK